MKTLNSILVFALCFFFDAAYAQNDSKQELKKLADDLTQQIKQKGNKRIAVASFTDQQNNVTELGKYLSQQFIVNLIRNGLDVVDRSRIEDLMEENKMSSKGLLDPKNQAKLGQLVGIEVIIVGTTTPSDKSVELIITALDITRGSGIAGTDGSITRTDAINDLLRSNVKVGGGSSSIQETPNINNSSKDLGYTLMGDKSFDMEIKNCLDINSKQFGQICFENTLKMPLVLWKSQEDYNEINMLIGSGARNCTNNLFLGYAFDKTKGKELISNNYTFLFHTTEQNENERRYGKIQVLVEGCKVKTRVINADRLFLSKTKP
jgi:TolB-like protein